MNLTIAIPTELLEALALEFHMTCHAANVTAALTEVLESRGWTVSTSRELSSSGKGRPRTVWTVENSHD